MPSPLERGWNTSARQPFQYYHTHKHISTACPPNLSPGIDDQQGRYATKKNCEKVSHTQMPCRHMVWSAILKRTKPKNSKLQPCYTIKQSHSSARLHAGTLLITMAQDEERLTVTKILSKSKFGRYRKPCRMHRSVSIHKPSHLRNRIAEWGSEKTRIIVTMMFFATELHSRSTDVSTIVSHRNAWSTLNYAISAFFGAGT